VQPDYTQFFPFAFFFTMIHVVAMMVATVPTGSWAAIVIAALYLIGTAIGLLILFRR
jgi:NADH-quinone oxidoreductase subunit A